MDRKMRLFAATLALALLAVPATATADATWNCSATAGWATGKAPVLGGDPCPVGDASAGSAAGITADGKVRVDGGGASQTTDTRQPRASVDAKTITLANPDGSFRLDASGLSASAQGSCDPTHRPAFTSGGSPGTVTLNGRPIDTSRDYTEPGVGVNGAPLFGKIDIHFGEVTKAASSIGRREIHVIVTDRDGAIVFEAVAGEVVVGSSTGVCDPPPVCPPGEEPQAGRCVELIVSPLPPPPPAGAPPSIGPVPAPKRARGCRDANALAKQVSTRRIAAASLCLMNVERKRRHLRALRANTALRGAAAGHARTLVAQHVFAHGDVLGRILRSGYLKRFGNWHVGENLGWGWGGGASPRALVRSWMRSPSHRRNILSRQFRDVGVAAALGSPGKPKRGSIVYVVDFGGSG
jgi:uncharacterized protein YkwD